MGTSVVGVALLAALTAGCDDGSERALGYSTHDEPRDLDPPDDAKFDGPLASFSADLVLDDAMFTDVNAVTPAAIQALLESSPYGNRSFLADETVGGQPFSQVLVDVALAKQLNPVLLLVRLQVEKSLVSKSQRPSGNTIDFAMGCGCPDGEACSEAYRGIDKQLGCAANTLRKHFDGSVDGTGSWRMGTARSTLDPQSITPGSHATASLYAYTPWVLEDTGGNWLVWNVTRKYVGALIDSGAWGPSGGDPSAGDPSGGDPSGGDPSGGDPSGGDPSGGDPSGSGSCSGTCGSASPVDNGGGTECYCDLACTQSGDCCAGYDLECNADTPAQGSCAQGCGSADPVDVGDGTECYCDEICAGSGDCCADYAAQCG